MWYPDNAKEPAPPKADGAVLTVARGKKPMADPADSDEGCFWTDKVPCWIIRTCSRETRCQCAAYLDQSRPCWEHDDTLTKKFLHLDTCFACDVFRRYGPPETPAQPSGENTNGRSADRRR